MNITEVLESIWVTLLSIVENWSMIICFASAVCLIFFAWTHRPWKVLTSILALSIGIAGAFL